MGKLKLTSAHRRGISIAAMVVAALMLADALYQTGVHVAWRRWLPATLAGQSPTTQPADTQPAETQPAETQPAKGAPNQKPSKPPQIHAAIKKRNIFTKPKSKGHGMKLTGVIGNIALFNKGAIEEGKSGHGIKVVSIEGYDVTIEYKGKTEIMKLFPDSEPTGGAPPAPSGETLPPRPSPESSDDTKADTQPFAPNTPAGINAEKVHETKPAIHKQGGKP